MVQRSNSHVWIGLAFVMASMLVAAAIYAVIKVEAGPTESAPAPIALPSNAVADPAVGEEPPASAAQTLPENPIDSRKAALTHDDFVGGFSTAVGDDGSCAGTSWFFQGDGTFESSAENGSENGAGHWMLTGDILNLTGVTISGADSSASTPMPDFSLPVTKFDEGLKIGTIRYIACADD